ncbi:hypothetical protein [Nonomuraea typhae]|uniref:WD40 repeat domain-containing protein n=1 Tax=Nonomuraea typhae TaxID=2603600 RepID=A0ABW7Z8I0_9ACTN
MDEFARMAGERRRKWTSDASPPPDLYTRILDSADRRRHALTGSAALLVVVVLIPVFAVRGVQRGTDEAVPRQTSTEQPTADLLAPDTPGELHTLLRPGPPARIPVRVGDLYFNAESLGEGGTVLGTTGFDADPYRATDYRVWLATPSESTPTPIAVSVRGARGRAAGTRGMAWAEPRDDAYVYQLMCVQDGAAPRQVGKTGVAKAWRPVHMSGDEIVWTDEANATWVAFGCRGEPRRLLWYGPAVAFACSDVYVTHDRRLERVDLRDESASTMAELPGVHSTDQPVLFAATPYTVAWVEGRIIKVHHWRERRTREFPVTAHLGTEPTELTAGTRLIVLTARPWRPAPAGSRRWSSTRPQAGRSGWAPRHSPPETGWRGGRARHTRRPGSLADAGAPAIGGKLTA